MSQKIEYLVPILEGQSVIPVLLIDELRHAVPLAQALANGGLTAIEVTLRTAVALDAIQAIAENVPDIIVGAGTVLNSDLFEAAEDAGAQFMVSPGLTNELLDIAHESEIPLLPGAITPSEIMAALEEGYQYLKFFPAEAAGGVNYLKSLASPLADVKFCPTGGISAANASEWLNLPNVVCVGGSWIAPKKLLDTGDWEAITALAQEAAQF